ncbi:MAG: radical SAM family heme chaperone HemW [Janthinobacterium lividum]
MQRPVIPLVPAAATAPIVPGASAAATAPTAPSAPAPRQSTVQTFLAPGRIRLPANPPLSLYVHFPWCVRKCPYCDFNSHEFKGPGEFPEDDYLNALRADLEHSLPWVWGRRIHTVFIGGGTPSLLSAAGLDRMLSDIRALLPLDADAEITLEANPGTFEAAKFAEFRASGVNRLSIGIQSFNPRHLESLGRIHDDRQAHAAIETAARLFDNFNLDLMFALPGQTLAESQQDVETALSYAPPHLSLYHLTLEPNTLFHRFPPALPDDDASADMSEWIERRMGEAGFDHYETSAYARPNRQSRHNLNYWRFGDYLGVGPGAHGKLSFPERVLRQVRHKHPLTYLREAAVDPLQEQTEIDAADLPFEFMLNALRLTEGFPISLFYERTGLPIIGIERALRRAEASGLLERDHERIKPTARGRLYLNDLLEMFLRD